MKRVLYICEGNVGRSQMAEGFHTRLAGPGSAASAGCTDVGARYGFHPRADIVQVMQEIGIDISGQRIKHISEAMLRDAHTAVVLCRTELLPAFVGESGIRVIVRTVPDPASAPIADLRSIRDAIEQIVLGQLR